MNLVGVVQEAGGGAGILTPGWLKRVIYSFIHGEKILLFLIMQFNADAFNVI
jgi:hypothetical protein